MQIGQKVSADRDSGPADGMGTISAMSFRCALAVLLFAQIARGSEQTYCNPLDLNYGLRATKGAVHRHGADPVIVFYNDKYWLFSTWDRSGVRVSDDLVSWTYVPF